ncbi:MAG: Imm30 family immunity protein [Chloroflexota bacterium]
MNDVLDDLVRTRHLQSTADVERFTEALERLPQVLDEQTALALYDVFDDDVEIPEVMFGLIHRLEKFDPASCERVLLSALPGLLARAPWWTETIVVRFINNPVSRRQLVEASKVATPEQVSALRATLSAIAAVHDRAGDLAREIMREL